MKMILKKFLVIGLFFILTGFSTYPFQASGSDAFVALKKDTTLHTGKLAAVLSAEGALYFGSLGGLYFAFGYGAEGMLGQFKFHPFYF